MGNTLLSHNMSEFYEICLLSFPDAAKGKNRHPLKNISKQASEHSQHFRSGISLVQAPLGFCLLIALELGSRYPCSCSFPY